jgi:hypothetical protein
MFPLTAKVSASRSADNGARALSPSNFSKLTLDETETWAKWSGSSAPSQNEGVNRPGSWPHHRTTRPDLLQALG